MFNAKALFILFTAALVLAGHVGLWQSGASFDLKLKLTMLNAVAWSVLIFSAYTAMRWLALYGPDDQNSQSAP